MSSSRPMRVVHDPESGGVDLSSRDLELPANEAGWRPPVSSSRGTGSSPSSNVQQDTLFFPLPYNDEQEEVIRRLEAEDSPGVTVQGPPGTGKTHTIANIISHFLATRRRVLVTAKTPEALRALQEKIPEGIRDLAISVIQAPVWIVPCLEGGHTDPYVRFVHLPAVQNMLLAALKGDRDSPWRLGGSGRNARPRLPQRLLRHGPLGFV